MRTSLELVGKVRCGLF